MADREKVVKELEHIQGLTSLQCLNFPNERMEFHNLIADVLALLKEQKTGHWVSVNDEDVVAIDNDGFPERACFCSECKKYLIASDEYAVYGRYCPFCGAKMET